VAKTYLQAQDFADQTLITYPVHDDMLDVVRQVLEPAGVAPARRTTELTIAMLQLVASGRGIAALPVWAVQSYIDRAYVTARPIGSEGLLGQLFIACSTQTSTRPWLADFGALPARAVFWICAVSNCYETLISREITSIDSNLAV
jgi:LysR family transcriptional regulator, regulator for metE and metH